MEILPKSKKVLVIEDEASIRTIVKELLLDIGIQLEFHEAQDGALGFMKYKKVKYDLLIVDMTMPKLSGEELIKNIREFDDKTKILVLTSCADKEVIQEVLSFGVQGWIIKPIDEESFKAKVHKLLS